MQCYLFEFQQCDLELRSLHELPLESMDRGVKPILEDRNFNNSCDPYAHTFAYIAKENYLGKFLYF